VCTETVPPERPAWRRCGDGAAMPVSRGAPSPYTHTHVLRRRGSFLYGAAAAAAAVVVVVVGILNAWVSHPDDIRTPAASPHVNYIHHCYATTCAPI